MITIKDLKQALHILDENLPIVVFDNGYKADIRLTLTADALLISAEGMPKPSIKTALDEKEAKKYEQLTSDTGENDVDTGE